MSENQKIMDITALSADQIAQVCHETNRAYCKILGYPESPSWDEAPDWMRESAILGVLQRVSGKVTNPEQSHEDWMELKLAQGWVYGPQKDPEKKEHNCLVPYDQLPITERVKDQLFLAVVDTLNGCFSQD